MPGRAEGRGQGLGQEPNFNPGAPPAVPFGEVIIMFKLRSVVGTSRQWPPAPIALATAVGAVVVVTLLARPAVVEAPTEAAETAGGPRPYTGAAGASCTHPLFVGLKYAAGDEPLSVAIGDLDGVNGPDLAVANLFSDDVSVLLKH